jgi:hypothetical protein
VGEGKQAALVLIMVSMLSVGTSSVLFVHSVVLAVLTLGLAALCGVFWVVRRVRYAKGLRG